MGIKLTKGQMEALICLQEQADSFLNNYPGTTSDFALSWQTFEPNYCWPNAYGFSSQSMQSLVRNGLAGGWDWTLYPRLNYCRRQAMSNHQDLIEKVARAICENSGGTWRKGEYPIASGENFEVEHHDLDKFITGDMPPQQPSPLSMRLCKNHPKQ
ncbi:hypothetical protein [Phyllobacterium sp. K27]